jgi:hypothetical protein
MYLATNMLVSLKCLSPEVMSQLTGVMVSELLPPPLPPKLHPPPPTPDAGKGDVGTTVNPY